MTDVKTFEITDSALRNIRNMRARVWAIECAYGKMHEHTVNAADSLLNCLETIFAWPGKVFAEDDLSLLVVSNITIGIIWHPRRITVDGVVGRDELIGTWSAHS